MLNKHIKISISLLFLSAMFVPSLVSATDTRCWEEQACIDGGGQFWGPTGETIQACQTDKDPTGKNNIGFCLPVGSSETQIGFGGKKVFDNIGVFIKWVYQYGVQVAGGLAVFMIIVAGFQWATSGGSPEKIGAAKKRIGGAMMGLFIAVLSFFILNQVNPYLVNLRMPKIWKVNNIGLVPPYCDEVQEGKKVGEKKDGPFDKEPMAAECGKEYYVEGSVDAVCKGTLCKGRGACVPFGVSGGKKTAPFCSDEYVNIHYKADSSAQTAFDQKGNFMSYLLAAGQSHLTLVVNQPNWLDDEGNRNTMLVVMCEDGGVSYPSLFNELGKDVVKRSVVSKDAKDKPMKYNEYLLQISSGSIQKGINGNYKCIDGGKAIGFYIKNEVDIDSDFGDFNFYLSSIPESPRKLLAARWGGLPGGKIGWYIPFDIFKEKNHLFELNLTKDMLENVAGAEDTEPALGKKAGGATAFDISEEVKDWWADQAVKAAKWILD